MEEKPGSALLRVISSGTTGAVGGVGLRRNAEGNSTIGIGWESGEEARWDLDLMAGSNDLNLNNKNISGNLLLNFGKTLRFGYGTSEKPQIPDIAMIDLDGMAVGTTVRSGIPNRSIGLPNGGAVSFVNDEGTGQGSMFTGLDVGPVGPNQTVSLEAMGSKMPYAVITVFDDSGKGVAMFVLLGSSESVSELLDPNEFYSTHAGKENSVNIYFNKSLKRYELENKTGTSSQFLIFYLRKV